MLSVGGITSLFSAHRTLLFSHAASELSPSTRWQSSRSYNRWERREDVSTIWKPLYDGGAIRMTFRTSEYLLWPSTTQESGADFCSPIPLWAAVVALLKTPLTENISLACSLACSSNSQRSSGDKATRKLNFQLASGVPLPVPDFFVWFLLLCWFAVDIFVCGHYGFYDRRGKATVTSQGGPVLGKLCSNIAEFTS